MTTLLILFVAAFSSASIILFGCIVTIGNMAIYVAIDVMNVSIGVAIRIAIGMSIRVSIGVTVDIPVGGSVVVKFGCGSIGDVSVGVAIVGLLLTKKEN